MKLLKYNCELCKIQSMVSEKQPGAINVVRFQNSLSETIFSKNVRCYNTCGIYRRDSWVFNKHPAVSFFCHIKNLIFSKASLFLGFL